MIIAPTEQNLFDIVVSTHAADRITISKDDTQKTWKKEIQNPYAHGHFMSLMYILHNLRLSADFPVKEPALLTDIQKSSVSLAWLKTLYTKMTEPLINSPLFEGDLNGPSRIHLSQYRYTPTLAITKQAPDPSMIPAIMHNWIKDIGTYHHSIKNKVLNPFAFNANDAKELMTTIREIPLFFSIVQPFGYGNQRLGRLVEIAFRWIWNVPIVYYWPNSKEYDKLLEDLQTYEKEKLPLIIEKAKSVK